jgi:hypothetical protein
MRFEGKPVWIGQISRDIGVRFTSKTWYLMTHKVDPDVGETRSYLMWDLLDSEVIQKVGFVSGVGLASVHEPRLTITGDPYFTDGLRAVFLVSHEPTPYSEVQFFDWDFPPGGEQFRKGLSPRNR